MTVPTVNTMSHATVSVCVLAAAGIALANNFEDEPRNFGSQLIRRFTAVQDLLFVRNRNFPSNTIGRCHAMRKDQRLGIHTFRYLVYTALNPQQAEYDIFPTPLTLSKTHPHTLENAAKFRTEAGGVMSLFKLLYADVHQGCYLLVRNGANDARECLLLQTAYTVDRPIPSNCYTVYIRSCRGVYVNLYDRTCTHLLRRNRALGG